MTLIEDMFRRFIERQHRYFNGLSKAAKAKLAAIENKYAELRVTGPEGGIFYFQFRGQRLLLLDKPPAITKEKLDIFIIDGDSINYPSGDEVIFDVIDGSLTPRAAVSRQYFCANTSQVIYDTEEFAQAFENFLSEMRRVLSLKRQ